MRFFVSCPFGLNGVLQWELRFLWLKPYQAFATWAFFDWNLKDMYKANIWSRIANKIYLELAQGKCTNFDELFELVENIDWKEYINKWQNIIVNVNTKWSKLESTRSIQSISNKAIFKKISPKDKRHIDETIDPVNIFITIIKDQTSVFVNSSGKALYKRWYRIQRWAAPIKENLAAGLILMSRWNYRDVLRDPFCGSGTFGIEAALLAKNIAPGLNREFAFQKWENFDEKIFAEVISEFEKQIIKDKKHQIYLSDISANMLEIAITNAKEAGVFDFIDFKQWDVDQSPIDNKLKAHIISNPPYWKRLETSDLRKLYNTIIGKIENSQKWGFITSREDCKRLVSKNWKSKKLYNWADEAIFYFL